MAVYIVDDLCKVDDRTGVIVVRSDSLEPAVAYAELQGPAARRAALIKAAQCGLPDPRVNSTPTPIPVDENNEEVLDTRKQTIKYFQCEIPVIRRLV